MATAATRDDGVPALPPTSRLKCPDTSNPPVVTTRILLIEDNARDVRLVKIALAEALDFQHVLTDVRSFADGMDALDHGPFDVVLLDLNLPDKEGIATVEALVAEHQDVPIIVLTGLEDTQLGDKAIRAGAQDFLVKGKMFGELLWRAIRYARERHKILMELQAARGA